MKRGRLKKICLGLLLLFVCNELFVHRTQTIAPAIALAPLAYDAIVLGATALGSLYSAYLISQLSDDVLKIHSLALPTIAQELREQFPQAPATSLYSQQEVTHVFEQSIGHASLKAAYNIHNLSSVQEREILELVNTNIITPSIERTKYIGSIPTNAYNQRIHNVHLPASPIQVTYQPNKIRIDLPHINTYVSAGISQREQLSPARRRIIEDCHNHRLEAAVHEKLMNQDPQYSQNFIRRFNTIIAVFYDLVSNDICKRAAACLTFPFLEIEEPYNYKLQMVIDELIPLYFDTDGYLIHINSSDTVARNFIIAKFLKNGHQERQYLQLLKRFNFHEVLAHEESTGTYLWNGLYHIVTGGWLPTVPWYPHNIKQLISENGYNKNVEMILTYCSNNNFAAAYKIIENRSRPMWHMLYNESYQTYKEKYCDEYGVLTAYAQDPLWVTTTYETKHEYAKDINALTQLNNALKVRHTQKTNIQTIWQISNDMPYYVHDALYNLIEYLGTGIQFIAKTTEIIILHSLEERHALEQALYLPNGILKDFSHFPGCTAYQFPSEIFHQPELLSKINELFYLQHVLDGTHEGLTARLELDQLQMLHNSVDSKANYASLHKTIGVLTPYISKIEADTEKPPAQKPPIDDEADDPEEKKDSKEDKETVDTTDNDKPEISIPSKSGGSSATGDVGNVYGEGNPQPPDEDDCNYNFPEPPQNKNDWPKNKKSPWIPPAKDWSSQQALAYLQFLGHEFLRAGLAAMGIPYKDFVYALELFKEIPGFLSRNSAFQQVIRHCYKKPIACWNEIKGFVYELQTALKLESRGEKILEFGRKIPEGEIDILTTNRVIECKNVNWNLVEDINNYKAIFGKQLKYARATWDKTLTVFSKNPLPQTLKNWFDKKGIEYFEG